jgi:hypothetical protein
MPQPTTTARLSGAAPEQGTQRRLLLGLQRAALTGAGCAPALLQQRPPDAGGHQVLTAQVVLGGLLACGGGGAVVSAHAGGRRLFHVQG